MVTAWRATGGPGAAAQRVADRITSTTGGRITVNLSAAGEIVPALGVFDAVVAGTAELYHAVPAGSPSPAAWLLRLLSLRPHRARA